MVVEELITVLGFRTKGTADLDKARAAYERFLKSINSGSKSITAALGKGTGLFELQGRQIRKNERVISSIARTMDRLGGSVRTATLNLSGLSKSYDGVTKAARKARVEMAAAGRAQRRSGGSNLSSSTALVAPRIKRSASGRGRGRVDLSELGPIAGVVGAGAAVAGYKEAAAFDRRLTLIGQTAEASRPEIEGLNRSIRDLAQETATPVDKLTNGLDSLVTSGRNLKEAMDFLPAVARTAAASGSQVEDIANTADSVGSNFELSAKQMQNAFDLMAAAGKSGKFELKDMARYLPSLAPAAAAIGMKGEKGLADLVSMLQTIRKGTGTTEEAATSLTNIFQKLESEETTKKFEKMEVDLAAGMKKARQEGRNLIEAFEELALKATKGDLSKLPNLIADEQFGRGVRALLTYRGEWQKLSATIQNTSKGTIARDLPAVLKDAQSSVDRLSNGVKDLTSSLAALSDKGGVSKGLTSTAIEFGELAAALERINKAYDAGGLKGVMSQVAGDAAERVKDNRKAWLDQHAATEDKRIQELEADNKATEEKLRREGYSPADIEKTMKLRREAVEKARRRKAAAQASRAAPELQDKSPLRMGQDPTAPISGQPGVIGQGSGSLLGRVFGEAYPLDTSRPIRGAPLPPRRPDGLPSQGGINTINDILGPAKPKVDASEIEAAKDMASEAGAEMKTSLNGSYHPTVDISSITAAITAAHTFSAAMRGVAAGAGSAASGIASTAAGKAVIAAGRSGGSPSAGAGTMTASLRRDMSSSTQVAKLARAAKGRGGISNSVGDVHVNVAATNASPKDIGRATQDSLSRRLARSWSVTAPEPSSA